MNDEQKARLAELRNDKRHSSAEKAEFAELERLEATEMEAMEAANSPAPPQAAAGQVYVFANLESGQSFVLPSGEVVTIQGMSVSSLRRPEGGFYPGGKYGITPVDAAKWAEVVRVYGKMKMFESGLVFAAETIERGQAMARERGGLRHGFEPIDPTSRRVKTKPVPQGE